MADSTAKPSIYPPYCFDAAPTFNVSSFLRITDISSLQLYRNIPGIHFHRNLPIRWVRIAGVIVGIDDYPQRRVYTVDDSSGLTIECVLELEARPENTSNVLAPGPLIPPEYSGHDVGHVVDLRGPIIPYHRQKAIKVRRMKQVPTTHHELLLWERRSTFKSGVLDVPWVLSDEKIRKYRRKAERAVTKDSDKRKRMAQEAVGEEDDPFKLRKRIAKPLEIRPHNQGHHSSKATNCENPKSASKPSIDRHGYGDKQDPYSLKASMVVRPALSTAPRTAPSRTLNIPEDPFKITKRGSRKDKLPQPAALPLARSIPTIRPSMEQKSVGNLGSSEPSQKEKSTPAPNPPTQRTARGGIAEDPYVIKARGSRRTLPEVAAAQRRTSANSFRLTRSSKDPCLERNINAELPLPRKGDHASARKEPETYRRHGGSGLSTGADDDPFRLRRRVRK